MTGRKRNPAVLFGAQALLIYVWLTDLSALAGTDTYYSVYLLCGTAALLCLWDNRKGGRGHPALWVFAGLFSLAVVLGNHEIYEPASMQNRLNFVMDLLGGFCVGYQILRCMLRRLPLKGGTGERKHPGRVFWGVFAAVAVIDLGYLVFAHYPGILTRDSYTTIGQLLYGHYDNTMPYYHTRLVGLIVKLGMALTGDINFGVALFHGFQILLLAAVFGYTIMTLYQIGVPRWMLGLVFFVYALLPYNIVYSITLWKDVPFGASALLLAAAFCRLLKHVGKTRKWDYAAFTLGAAGMALMRTNGWYALLAAAVLLAVLLRKEQKRLVTVLLAVLVVTWVMIGPLLTLLQVPGTDPVEAFAVPMQQVARVAASGRELTEDQQALLSEIFLMDKLGEVYDPQTVDPVKYEAFRYNQVEYIRQNAGQYLKLYVSLGLRYPGDYLKAWIDETRGYWNGGYFYWIYTLEAEENNVGIVPTAGTNPIARLYAAWFRLAEKPTVFQPLYSIGLRVWILIACCAVCCLQKRKQWLMAVPALVLTIGLWLGTPVYAEFRYAYPMVLCSPLALLSTVFEPKTE
ncbi:MAG: DUF6020 family protein [Eubacteriales bacterium]|nr:DUF6020 family protein [Eubacteriales bacterium]